MQGEIFDYPTRLLIHSEAEGDKAAYLVDLCAYPVTVPGEKEVYNGACQCKDFIYRCEPKLRLPDNAAIHRCKHCRAARAMALDFILPEMDRMDPNEREEHS